MKIVITSTEFEGLIKVGGLADAINGISYSLAKLANFEVNVIIPNYMNLNDSDFKKIDEITIIDSNNCIADLKFINNNSKKLKFNVLYKKDNNINFYLIDNDYFFNRSEVYGYDDDLLRWSFFSRSICEIILREELNPDIIHINDYHEGLVPFLFKTHFPDLKSKFVLSVHNAYFQGHYEFTSDDEKLFFEHLIDYEWEDKDINLLKEALLKSDQILTVSQDYAEGIQEEKWGNGLEDIYKEKGVIGIINGLNLSLYDREVDDFKSYLDVKDKYKLKLQKRFNLKEDKDFPIITYICRLGIQKGSNLVFDSINNFIENSQFILLGKGVEEFEEKFSSLNGKLDNYHAIIDFDSDLARELYIASDIFLMPSCFEPCGIAQLIAHYYASIPIVTNVGGLKDTITDYPSDNANGFKIKDFSVDSLTQRIFEALDIYLNNKSEWLKLMENAYNSDNSWDDVIKKYVEIYEKLV